MCAVKEAKHICVRVFQPSCRTIWRTQASTLSVLHTGNMRARIASCTYVHRRQALTHHILYICAQEAVSCITSCTYVHRRQSHAQAFTHHILRPYTGGSLMHKHSCTASCTYLHRRQALTHRILHICAQEAVSCTSIHASYLAPIHWRQSHAQAVCVHTCTHDDNDKKSLLARQMHTRKYS